MILLKTVSSIIIMIESNLGVKERYDEPRLSYPYYTWPQAFSAILRGENSFYEVIANHLANHATA